MGEFLTKERQKEIILASPQFQPEEVIKGLVDGGHELEGLNAEFSAFDAITNIPKSTVELGKNIFAALKNPVQSVKALSKIALGGFAAGFNKISPNKISASNVVPGSDEAFDQIKNMFDERYGSLDDDFTRTLETIERDPAGFLSDVATFIGGPVSALRKGAKSAGLSRTARVLGKVSKGARGADPIRIVSKTAQAIARKSNIGLGIAHIFGKSANRFTKSSLGLSKKDITNLAGELGKKAGNPVEIFNRLGIHGSLEEIATELGKRKKISMANLDRVLNASTKTYATPLIQRAFRKINDTIGVFDSPEKRLLRKTTGRLLEKMKRGGVTLNEITEVKRIAQEFLGEKVFKPGGDIKASKIADTLKSDMNRLKSFVEEKASIEGLPDVQRINKQTQFFRGMEKFVNREITGIPSPARNLLQTMLIGGAVGAAAAGRTELAIGSGLLLVGLKVFTSTKFRTALGTKLRSISDAQVKLIRSAHAKKKKILSRAETKAVKEFYGGLSQVFPELRVIGIAQKQENNNDN